MSFCGAGTPGPQKMVNPYQTGTYIGESDTVERPANAMDAFTPEKWQRLCTLRDRYAARCQSALARSSSASHHVVHGPP
jgi:hypothetical protein